MSDRQHDETRSQSGTCNCESCRERQRRHHREAERQRAAELLALARAAREPDRT